MTDITIVKDTDDELIANIKDYTLQSGDSAVFKFAANWGDMPIGSVDGVLNTDSNYITFAISKTLTSPLVISDAVGTYVYEIEGVFSGEKKVLNQGSLFIKNTI